MQPIHALSFAPWGFVAMPSHFVCNWPMEAHSKSAVAQVQFCIMLQVKSAMVLPECFAISAYLLVIYSSSSTCQSQIDLLLYLLHALQVLRCSWLLEQCSACSAWSEDLTGQAMQRSPLRVFDYLVAQVWLEVGNMSVKGSRHH